MTKRAAVTYAGLVRDATNFRVVKDGVAREVIRGLKVCNGVACEFWPRTDFTVREVLWTTEEETSIDVVTDPLDAQAAIQFLLADGRYYLDGSSNIDRYYVSPPIDGTGLLLVRWNTVSGTLSSNITENVWFDMYDNGPAFIASVFIDQTVPGVNLAVADIDIAPDSGGGVPGTIVTKRINFHAEVLNTTDVTMSTVPWDLNHETVNEAATCSLLLQTDLTVRGKEGIIDAFIEQYGPVGQDPSIYGVQLDLISGTAPQVGPPLGVAHNLGAVQEWQLQALTGGEEYTGEYDMTVAGPLNAVVKRVTMHVKRTDDLSRIDPGWDGIPTLILEGNVPEFTTVTLDHLIDGTSDLSVVGIPDPGGWPSNWHLDAPTPPDPENYEVMIELISDTPPSGAAIDTWLNASSAYQWVWDMNGLNGLLGVIDWHYRRIGQPSSQSTRRVSITLTRGDPI